MDAYGNLLGRWLWPAWERGLRGRETPTLLRYLQETQWLSQGELRDLQSGALHRLLRHAHSCVPWYQRAFAERGISPGDIYDRDTLSKLPILTRADARDHAEDRVATRPPPIAVRKSTSGTMGMPLSFGYDQGSEEWRNAIRLRSYDWCGYPVGARSLHYWARSPKTPPLRSRAKIKVDRTLRRELYVDCTPRSDADLADVVATVKRYRPEVIITFSQAGASLARYINRTDSRAWSDIAVICGAEKLLPADRQAMNLAFGEGVFETYGSRETMLMACDCEVHEGLHEASENIVLEIVVRDGGKERPANPGEVGDVVVTDLHNLAMPFIRYANGDRAMAVDHAPCPCGRGLFRIGAIEGRVAETLHDGAGNEVSGLVFNLVFVDIAAVSREFQVVQHADRSITVRIVPTDEFADAHVKRLRDQCQEYLPGITVAVERVREIPLTAAGKRKVVIVEEPSPAVQP